MRSSVTEHAVLGVVWRDGPCTTYHVMRELAASPSSFYRNRAATAYRAVQRLTDDGLLEFGGDEVGARGERPIRISEDGVAALQAWLRTPLPYEEVAHSVDLIRVRLYSIGALSVKERQAFLAHSLAELRRYQDAIRLTIARERAANDPFGALGTTGLLYETEARIAWLEAIREDLLGLK